MARAPQASLRQLRVSGQAVTAQYVADFLHVPLAHVLKIADRQLHNRQGLEWAMFHMERKHDR